MQAPSSQTVVQHDLANNIVQNTQINTRPSFGQGYFANDNPVIGSIMVQKPLVENFMMPVTLTIPKQVPAPQYSSVQTQNPRYNPVNFGPNLRGVSF